MKIYIASKLKHGRSLLTWFRDAQKEWPDSNLELSCRWITDHITVASEPAWPADRPAFGSVVWDHDYADVESCDAMVVYGDREDDLRGAIFEAGIAVTLKKIVIVVGTCRSYGSWQHCKQIKRVNSLTEAVLLLRLMQK
jgi:hypothetical protein